MKKANLKKIKIKSRNYYDGLRYYVSLGVSVDPKTCNLLRRQFTASSEQQLRDMIEQMQKENDFPPAVYKGTWIEYGCIINERNHSGRSDKLGDNVQDDLSAFDLDIPIQKTDMNKAREIMACLNDSMLSHSRKRNVYRLLRNIEDDAVKNNLIKGTLFEHLKLKPLNRTRLYILAEEECQRIYHLDPSDGLNAYLQFLLFSGVRSSEGRGCAAADMDEVNGKIRISRQLQRNRVSAHTKTCRYRDIYLPVRGFRCLNIRLEQLRKDRVDAGDNWMVIWDKDHRQELELLFVDKFGVPVSKKAAIERLREILHGTEHSDAVLSCLRRTGLTRFYHASGHNRKAVMIQSGDEWSTLIRHYLIPTQEELRELVRLNDEYYFGFIKDNERSCEDANAKEKNEHISSDE